MLEASSFDFRTRHPQQLIIKLARHHRLGSHSAVTKTAHLISLDLYKTYAPLKQCTAVMAFACLELAVRLHGQEVEAIADGRDYRHWDIDRPMVMGTHPIAVALAVALAVAAYLSYILKIPVHCNNKRVEHHANTIILDDRNTPRFARTLYQSPQFHHDRA